MGNKHKHATHIDFDTAPYRVAPGKPFHLRDRITRDDGGLEKSDGKDAFQALSHRLVELQENLYAEQSRALLVVMQAMDAGGKDSTLKAVFGPVDPAGCRVKGFKKPNDEELHHDYLWRIHHWLPKRGNIGVFNRSHYEDAITVAVKNLVPKKTWSKRVGHINDFERMLTDEGTTIVKFFLHISKDYQKERLQRRLDRPDNLTRIRLNSTAVRLQHQEGNLDADVEVTYVNANKASTVTASQVIWAGYHSMVPYICPDVPEPQLAAFRHSVRAPLVSSKALIRNWQSLAQLGIRSAYCPGSFYQVVRFTHPVSMGGYRFSTSPDEPVVLHTWHNPLAPGLPAPAAREALSRARRVVFVADPRLEGDRTLREARLVEVEDVVDDAGLGRGEMQVAPVQVPPRLRQRLAVEDVGVERRGEAGAVRPRLAVHHEGPGHGAHRLDQVHELVAPGGFAGVDLGDAQFEAEGAAGVLLQHPGAFVVLAAQVQHRPDAAVAIAPQAPRAGVVRAVDALGDAVEIGPRHAEEGVVDQVEVQPGPRAPAGAVDVARKRRAQPAFERLERGGQGREHGVPRRRAAGARPAPCGAPGAARTQAPGAAAAAIDPFRVAA